MESTPNLFDPDGGFADVESTITFIATKCDDISCSEVIGSLGLDVSLSVSLETQVHLL